jgi:hypothetical protein
MFLLQPPEVRETEVFTRMPDRFRRTGVRSDWADANRGGQPTDSFLEGPVHDAAGNLYVTDIPFGRIFRIDPHGRVGAGRRMGRRAERHEVPERKELLITDYRNGLMVCEISSGAVRPFLEPPQQRALQGRQRPHVRQPRQPVLHRPGADRPARSDRAALPAAAEQASSTSCSATCRARTASPSPQTSASSISA